MIAPNCGPPSNARDPDEIKRKQRALFDASRAALNAAVNEFACPCENCRKGRYNPVINALMLIVLAESLAQPEITEKLFEDCLKAVMNVIAEFRTDHPGVTLPDVSVPLWFGDK